MYVHRIQRNVKFRIFTIGIDSHRISATVHKRSCRNSTICSKCANFIAYYQFKCTEFKLQFSILNMRECIVIQFWLQIFQNGCLKSVICSKNEISSLNSIYHVHLCYETAWIISPLHLCLLSTVPLCVYCVSLTSEIKTLLLMLSKKRISPSHSITRTLWHIHTKHENCKHDFWSNLEFNSVFHLYVITSSFTVYCCLMTTILWVDAYWKLYKRLWKGSSERSFNLKNEKCFITNLVHVGRKKIKFPNTQETISSFLREFIIGLLGW